MNPPSAMLTPSMRSVLEKMARLRAKPSYKPMHELDAAQAREAYAKGADVLEVPKAQLARVENLQIGQGDWQMAARLYAPSMQKLPVLLYFHGGGFMIGSMETHDILCRELARLSGAAVISVDYRLAPEHAFPAAFDDAFAALKWLKANGATLGLDTQRIAIGGDSAGGTMAASLAHLARDAGIELALQLLIYPGTCGGLDTERFASYQKYGHGHVLEVEHIHYFFNSTLRNEYAGNPLFSPLNWPDFEDLAPCWMALAECDPLCDEGIAYADQLRVAGVTVDLEIYRGVTHEFIKMGRVIPEARQFHRDAALALQT
ncbi:MAG: alpha/beta hydrolase, partial [Brachymonas sp.]|nr:alpha/beta hydrolase [Brachymonas sp.]